MTRDDHNDFRDVPPPPGRRGFWLGVIALAIIGTVGIGGQVVGLRAIDALSKAELRLESMKEEENRIRTKLPQLRSDRDKALSDFTTSTDQLRERQSLLTTLKSDIDQKTSDRAMIAQEIADFNAAERSLEDVRREIQTMTAQRAELAGNLEKLDERQAEIEADRSASQKLAEASREDGRQLRLEIERLREERVSMRKQVSEAKDELAGEQQRVDRLTDLRKEWEKRTKRIADLTYEETEIENRLVGLEEREKNLKTRISTSKASLDAQESLLSKTEADTLGLVEQSGMRRDEIARKTEEISRLRKEKADLEDEIGDFRNQEIRLRRSIDDLQTQKTAADADLAESRSEAQRTRLESEEERNRSIRMQREVSQVLSELIAQIRKMSKPAEMESKEQNEVEADS